MADLLENARRCLKRGRYDDATARAYRTLEGTAQWLLQKRAVETGRFSATCTSLRPATLIAVKGANSGRLPEKIPLAEAWWVLALEEDPVAIRVGECDKKTGRWQLEQKLKGILKARNESIFAHGFTAVGEKAAGELIEEVERILSLAVGEDQYRELRDQVMFPQLPNLPQGGTRLPN